MSKDNSLKIDLSTKSTILITAGGTGGHIYPAESLAWELSKVGCDVIIISDERGKKFIKAFPPNIRIFIQNIKSLNFKNPLKILFSICLLLKGVLYSSYLLIIHKPSLVVGFGGYPTFPTILAAKLFGIKIVLHEGNAVLGRVNKLFSRKVNAIACGFWPTIAPSGSNLYFTGNPLRNNILSKKTKSFKLPFNGKLNLVVIGGSQGANFFSKIVPDSVSKLSIPLKERIHIIHQARSSDCQYLKKKYKKMAIKSDVKNFFYNIEDIFSDAHLIIARAGASTISEVLFFGKPLILIPIKNSIFDHQKLNASLLANKDAAFCIQENECTSDYLAMKISKILSDNKLAIKLSNNAKNMAVPEASLNLKEIILKIFNGEVVEFKN
ncbi:MAG: undecaprenyldiphospho-muramoylpentapeptide beta-N-acetylglucosaminyltransferase [Paracoccaceae bacterium]